MDRAEIKQLLKDQAEPLSQAVAKKLAYLQSDDVFTDTEEPTSLNDDSLMNAFAETTAPTEIPAYTQPKAREFYIDPQTVAKPKYADSEPSDRSMEEHQQNIAAKIAALRGISLPGDYLRKKQ